MESNDVINIYKEKTDPEIKNIEEYPLWLFEMALPHLGPYNAISAWQT